ncbi:MAG: GNAT family N-acetyltransferase, partial [Novosphingobium sp.]|nr:GNAT family N-acetyltransferase [Novosphingobium sp.]
MIAVEYHDDLKEVQSDPVLSALLSARPGNTPFDRLEWWRALSEESGMQPLVAVARNGGDRAVLALRRAGKRIEALANWYSFTVRPVLTPGADPVRLLRALACDIRRQAARIILAPLPDENGEASGLASAFRQAGWLVFREACDTNHVLHVAGRSFAAYLAGRPGHLRSTLRRKRSKVDITIETDFNPESWDAYEAVYARSWKPQEGLPALLRRFAEEEGRAGRLRMGLARAGGGQPVAAQFWTVEDGTAYIHKLAHCEQAKPLSAGTSLSAALFEHVIDIDRVSLVDFGTGDDAYKRDWMEDVRLRYRLDMMRPLSPENWGAIARKGVSHL